MTQFEKLFIGFTNDVESGRGGRIERNLKALPCKDVQQAIAVDNLQTSMVQGVFKIIGFTVDQVPLENGLRGLATLTLLEALTVNLLMVDQFANEVAMKTALEGEDFVVNPKKPDCPCENCQLARALHRALRGEL